MPMPPDSPPIARHLPPIMALTNDGLSLSHADQARMLVKAGVRWIQLRVKNRPFDAWLAIAHEVVPIVHQANAIVTINDSVDIALESGADGAHLGTSDGDWRIAREKLGFGRILGGTVHNEQEARRALDSQVLDYVGIGPLRMTATKRDLAPVLGVDGIAALLPLLRFPLAGSPWPRTVPAWAIGGIQPEDLPCLQDAGLSGVAVSSAFFQDGNVESQCHRFLSAWKSLDDNTQQHSETTSNHEQPLSEP